MKLAFIESRVRGSKHEFLYSKYLFFSTDRVPCQSIPTTKILNLTENRRLSSPKYHWSRTPVMKSCGTIIPCHDVQLF